MNYFKSVRLFLLLSTISVGMSLQANANECKKTVCLLSIPVVTTILGGTFGAWAANATGSWTTQRIIATTVGSVGGGVLGGLLGCSLAILTSVADGLHNGIMK
jgi:hypothetical protein